MYRDADLQAGLANLVGFRQNENPDYPQLSAALLQSESGLYVQDEHPLLSLENIDQALKNYDKFNFDAFSALESYAIGEKVRASDNKVYIAVLASAPEDPKDPAGGANGNYWDEYNLLSQKLDQVRRSAASKVLSAIFTDKKIREVTKAIFDNVQLFDGAGSFTSKEIKANRFVGFQIALESHRDLITVIKRLGTQFSAANPEFTLYVFHSSQEDPIATFTLNLTKVNSFQWSQLLDEDGKELTLKYLSDDYESGGAFYIGYYEEDLVGQAIIKDYDFGRTPCATCNRSHEYFTKWSRFIQVTPIEISSADLVGIGPNDPDGPKLWDIAKNNYVYTKNYGLNLDLTSRCDITDFIIRERQLLADPILKQITVDLLKELAYTTRNNAIAKEVRDLAIYTLNNKDNNTPGAEKKLELSLKAVSFDLSDLNSACMPCNDNGGTVNWATI
jgi:hypothetical protein